MTRGTISFDHVADIYDATRALPEDVACKLADALVAEIVCAGAGRVLEIGVGTGRIARPLAARGIRVCGVDIAPRMLARLREQMSATAETVDLVIGDATNLPLRSSSFVVVLAVHLLHLVTPLSAALSEVRRVLSPGGIFMRALEEGEQPNPWQPSTAKWEEIMTGLGFKARQRPGIQETREALGSLGGKSTVIPAAEWESRRTPAQTLARIAARVDSWTWEIPDDVFVLCLAEYERWVLEHYPDIHQEITERMKVQIEVWAFP